MTASGTYHRLIGAGGIWASTAAWGRNAEEGHATNALLLETNVTLDDRNAWHGRFEVAGKTAHDLDVPGDETVTVSKLQAGYTRHVSAWRGWTPGVGVSAILGASVVVGIACFVAIRQQAGVSDRQFLRSMIPHHASAILMCDQSPIDDAEIKMLCSDIVSGQQAEIDQMKAMLQRVR